MVIGSSPRSARVLRVLTARATGMYLNLHAEVGVSPSAGPGGPPAELVLQASGTDRELRLGLVPDVDGTGVSATIDVRNLLTGQGTTEWHVRAAREPGGDGGGYDVVSLLAADVTRAVVVPSDGDVHRVTPRTSDTGQLILAVEQLPPHAEVRRVWVEDDAIVIEAVLSRMPAPRAGAAASLVASSRMREVKVTAPATLDGPAVAARLPLQPLVADLPDTEHWDLHVQIEGGDRLRLAGYLDGVTDKKRAVVFPARDLRLPEGSRSLRPYFTIYNGLSIRSTPLQPTRPQAPPAASPDTPPTPSRTKALQRKGIHLLRRIALHAARTAVRRLPSRRSIPPVVDGRPHVSILVMHGYGMGGTIRTVFNQAEYLSRTHPVEILSQVRERREPFFPLPQGVTLTPLDDRTDAGRPKWPPLRVVRDLLARLPSLLVHEADSTFARCSLWTDVQLVRRLRVQRGGILMATRPSLSMLVAQLAAPEVITVGQSHLQFANHNPHLRKALPNHYRQLDALTTLTQSDLDDWTRVLGAGSTRLVRIPNSLTPLTGGLADPSSPVVVTVGRLTGPKGFDLAIRAFEQVVREHPEWSLRIYGSGPQSQRLRRMVLERELYNNVLLMGRTERVGDELAKASIFVLSSRSEGLPMVVIEAMSKGLAVVSTDCGGPGEIIDDGHDGLLVPNGDVDALAGALLKVIRDEDERRRLGAAALQKAGRFDGDVVGRAWNELFDRLLAERAPSWWRAESRS